MYANIPMELAGTRLSGAAWQVYIAIRARVSDRFSPSLSKISEDTGIARDNIPRLLRQIVDTGRMRVETRYDPAGDRTYNFYVFIDPTGVVETDNTRKTDTTPSAEGVVKTDNTVLLGVTTPGVVGIDTTNSLSETTRGIALSSESASRARAIPLDTLFEEFKSNFPSMTGGITPAFQAFERAIERGADPEQLIAEAKRYRQSRPPAGKLYCGAAYWLDTWPHASPVFRHNFYKDKRESWYGYSLYRFEGTDRRRQCR